MTPNILDSKSQICNEEDLQKQNHSRDASAIARNEKQAWSRYKIRMRIEEWLGFKTELKWGNIALLTFLHIGMLYTCFTVNLFEHIATVVWVVFLYTVQSVSVTAGAHRLWTHRAYKAKLPLRVLLAILFTSTGLNRMTDWVRDHRVHHKYTDTDADPHNSSRGFFFSHVGWLLMKKNPEVIRRGREIDISDVLEDPAVAFIEKYYWTLKFIFFLVVPIVVPVYGWNETWATSFKIYMFYHYMFSLHSVWSVNSVAHIWGSKPYDVSIKPTNNKLVAFMAFGEGWHNYHHVFPWDYKAAELGDYMLNITTMFIDFWAKIGWAYDLKQPSRELVMSAVTKRGDGSHHSWEPVAHPDSKVE